MINNQQETSVSFTQDELKLIINVFNACQIKLGDAMLMLPIVNKIFPLIKKEEPKPETNNVKEAEVVKPN